MPVDSRQRLQELRRALGQELESLETSLTGKRAAGRPAPTVDQAFAALTQFDALGNLLYRLRGKGGAGSADPQAEEYLAEAAQRILSLGQPQAEGGYDAWVDRYRRIWRANLSLFALTALLLLATGMIGWTLGTRRPDLVPVILPQNNMENVLDGRPWFEDLNDSPLMGGIAIARNNIHVGILSFAGAALGGVGGVVAIAYNGIIIGTMLGYCHANDFDEPLVEFMVSHGVLELSIIVAAAFAGLLYGSVFWHTPYKGFSRRMARAGRDAGVVLLGVLPWLILAGMVEAFVSPRQDLPTQLKLMVGAGIGGLFWVWTFAPLRRT